jgi:phage shock protein A
VTIWELPARLWTLGRKVDDLLELQSKTRTALETFEARLHALEERMTHLEAGQGQLITEAKAAAGAAATTVAGGVISDAVTRLTRVEMRVDEAERRLLPPPT